MGRELASAVEMTEIGRSGPASNDTNMLALVSEQRRYKPKTQAPSRRETADFTGTHLQESALQVQLGDVVARVQERLCREAKRE
jgi:hypothetical protein